MSSVSGKISPKRRRLKKITSPESFQFSAFNADYVVNSKSGKVQKTGGGVKKNFIIPLDEDDEIGRIYFSAYYDDLFLLYIADNGGEAATQFIRVDGKTNKLKWKIWLSTFNTKGTIDGDSGYFAGVGFVARVNLATGKFIWKHEDLYTEKYGKIQIFGTTKIGADKVIFRGDKPYDAGKEIVIDKTTGKILAVK